MVAETDDEVVDAVRDADGRGEPLLVLGGGSNLVVADEGFDGTVLQVATRGFASAPLAEHALQVEAGVDWDHVVALAVDEGYAGIEALSGIPGLVGAAPIQNIGAYGQEVAQTVGWVRALDRTTGDVVLLEPAQCGFAYRDSVFKRSQTGTSCSPWRSPWSTPGSARRSATPSWPAGSASRSATGCRLPTSAPPCSSCAAARAWSWTPTTTTPGAPARSSPTRCCPAERRPALPEAAPRWPASDGRVKVSAAWLIEQAGFGKGYGSGAARISTKHTLALTNRGGATTADLLALAREIRAGVRDRFGVTLDNEPDLVGVEL